MTSRYYADCFVQTPHVYECDHRVNTLNALFGRVDCAASFDVGALACAFLGPETGADLRYSIVDAASSLKTCEASLQGLGSVLEEITEFDGGRRPSRTGEKGEKGRAS